MFCTVFSPLPHHYFIFAYRKYVMPLLLSFSPLIVHSPQPYAGILIAIGCWGITTYTNFY